MQFSTNPTALKFDFVKQWVAFFMFCSVNKKILTKKNQVQNGRENYDLNNYKS